MPSATPSSAPSSRRPRMRTARGSAASTSAVILGSRRSPIERYGPVVWEGVSPIGLAVMRLLEWCRLTATEHDVEPEAERPVGLGQRHVEGADETRSRQLVAHRVEDRVEREERVVREVHLRDEALCERTSEEREVDVGGTPCIRVVPPGVDARLDGDEPVPAVLIREAAPRPREIGIERRVV